MVYILASDSFTSGEMAMVRVGRSLFLNSCILKFSNERVSLASMSYFDIFVIITCGPNTFHGLFWQKN